MLKFLVTCMAIDYTLFLLASVFYIETYDTTCLTSMISCFIWFLVCFYSYKLNEKNV